MTQRTSNASGNPDSTTNKWVLSDARLGKVLPAYADAPKRNMSLLRAQLEHSGVVPVYTNGLKQVADRYFENKLSNDSVGFFLQGLAKFSQQGQNDKNAGEIAALKFKKKVLQMRIADFGVKM